MVLDTHPLMTPNTVLTNALNATLITMNGNENVLQNDMGNARVENAKLPNGYVPIGMKEYGGIIYIACYNPTTNKGQIGCFPSPQRQKTATQISQLTPTFKFPDVTEPTTEGGYYTINSLLTKQEIFPTNTIIRSGDKFAIGLNLADALNTQDADYTAERYISNYNNTEGNLVKTPMNRMYTFGVATMDSNGQLRDITSQLKRFGPGETSTHSFTNNESDLYKFNYGYWQCSINNTGEDGTISSELLDTSSISSKLNTYNSKLFGKLFFYAKYNITDSVDISIVGYKKSDISNSFTNPIYSKDTLTIDKSVLLLIYINYKYNCPDGSGFLNNISGLPEPQEGYKYYFDKYSQDSVIEGIYLTLNIDGATSSQELLFSIPENNHKYYTLGYGYPIYDPITNLYSFSQLFALSLDAKDNSTIKWSATPIMNFLDGKLIKGLVLDQEISGKIKTNELNSGIMNLNTWNYFIDSSRVKLRWGFESYPRETDIISDITFDFYDISNTDDLTLDENGEVTSGTPRWTYITKNRLSYNGTFSEDFDINNFISSKASSNIFMSNSVFYVRISYNYNNNTKTDYRWLVLTGIYNPSYWGSDEYDAVQDYNNFTDCYYQIGNTYYEFTYKTSWHEYNIQTSSGNQVISKSTGNVIISKQEVTNENGYWEEVTKDSLDESKLKIPYYYFTLEPIANLSTSKNLSLTCTSTDNFVFTDKTSSPNYINETYSLNGETSAIVTLNEDNQHALKLGEWIPTINANDTTIKQSATVEYVGDIEDEYKVPINENNRYEKSSSNNSITLTYKNCEYQTVFGGEIGESNMKVLDKLENLEEFVTVENSNENYLNHMYAVCACLENDGKNDYGVMILPIRNSTKYSAEEALTVMYYKQDDQDSGGCVMNYKHRQYDKGSKYNKISSFKEQFAKLPADYNIIILGSLTREAIMNISGDTWEGFEYISSKSNSNTSIVELMRNESDITRKPDEYLDEEYTNRIFVLIRNINGEFTLVNYVNKDSNDTNITGIRNAWNSFKEDVLAPYRFYNTEYSNQLYTYTDNQFYNKEYSVTESYNISCTIDTKYISNYQEILSKYKNYQSLILNISNNQDLSINNLSASTTLCKIPSAKHFISTISANTSIVCINNGSIISEDTEGNPLKENTIYKLINEKLVTENSLKISQGKLYTQNIGQTLGLYPQYGWSTHKGRSHTTATLGDIDLVTLYDTTHKIE